MNYYKKSLKEFKRKLKENKNITREEWDKYAYENCLFSAFTLEVHNNVDNFEDLKKECRLFYIF